MNTLYKLLIFVVFVFFVTSCATTKKQAQKQQASIAKDSTKLDVSDNPTKYLFEKLEKNEFKFNWLNAKCSIKTDLGDANFSCNLRIRNDSAIWINITVLGMDAARVLITNDSVKLFKRDLKGASYFVGDFKYINKLFGVVLDYDIIQSFLTGNDFKNYETDKFKSSILNKKYLLSTIGRRKLKKSLNDADATHLRIEDIWVDPETFKIIKHFVNEFKLGNKAEVDYSDFRQVDDQLFPFKFDFEINSAKKVNATIIFSKVSINEPQTFPFRIPAGADRLVK